MSLFKRYYIFFLCINIFFPKINLGFGSISARKMTHECHRLRLRKVLAFEERLDELAVKRSELQSRLIGIERQVEDLERLPQIYRMTMESLLLGPISGSE